MEEIKMTVSVEVTVKDERFYFNILTNEGISLPMIRSILAGGLALSIRGEKTPETQAKAIKEVIDYLESEFINPDSFHDNNIFKD
jgi:hypothetical protein